MRETTASDELLSRLRAVQAMGMLHDAVAAAVFGAAVAIAFARPLPGVLAGALLAALLLSRATLLGAARRLEKGDPELDGAVSAFAEGGGGRLREPLAAWVLERRPRAAHGRSVAILLAAAAAAAGAAWVRSLPARAPTSAAPARERDTSAAAPALRVSVEVSPPAYAHRPVVRFDDPSGPIEALKGSTAALSVATGSPTVDVTEEGKAPRTLEATGGTARQSLVLHTSTALRIGAERVVAFRVVADLPPEIELTLPREDLTVTKRPDPFEVRAEARDDLGLESLAIAYTLAHGHGEGMKFKSGRIEGAKPAGLSGRMSARLDPSALGFGAGDTLVVWAEATDGNAVDGPGRSASAVRLLRWEEDLAPIELRSSGPVVRPLDGPLSQREILARTLRLLAENPPKDRLRERSLDLAQEQGRLRSAFGFFLRAEEGNAVELDVDDKEVAESGGVRARRLLAEAVSEMWSSEGELSTGNPRASVPHQRLALKKLDEAFGNERYALRALSPPKAAVDEGRRLKGDARELAPRATAETPDGRSEGETERLRSLARRLLLSSEGLTAVAPRALADELWALPEMAGLSRSTLAAPLYAARGPEDAARAERAAAEALLRFLDPSPFTRPAVAPGEARFFERLDAGAPPPTREGRKAPAR